MTGTPGTPTASLRAKSVWLTILLIVVVDQLTKAFVTRSLAPSESVPLVPSVLHLTYVQNTGAAFGILRGQTALFIILSVVAAAWIMRELSSRRHMPAVRLWSYALVLGGAMGNLIDRVRLGYVIDFIDFRVWPVFNVADSAITIGVSLLLASILSAALRPAASRE